MIKECNFRIINPNYTLDGKIYCSKSGYGKICDGEDNCILYQIYKILHKVNNYGEYFGEQLMKGMSEERIFLPNDEFTRILCSYHGHMAIKREDYNGKCPHCDRVVVEWDGSWLPYSVTKEEYEEL